MTTTNFSYTGGEQTFVVPAGVTSIVIDMYGAAGSGSLGGKGGRIIGTLVTTPAETLRVNIGGQAGFNGGGASPVPGGGGSDVRQGGSALANRVGVAGGGGGTSANDAVAGGAGGGSTGATGTSGSGSGGGGGTQLAGGAAGLGTANGTAGALGQGGVGGSLGAFGGGAGGGGYYGGGGGGGTAAAGGGGGGGSNFLGTLTSTTNTQGYASATGDGACSFTYTAATAPAAPTLDSLTAGNAQLSAAFTAGSDGGAAITSYKYSTDNGATYRTRQTGTTASPILITTLSADGTTPLANGTTYTVLIKAVNSVGDGTASNSLTGTPTNPLMNQKGALMFRVGGL